MIKHSTAKLLIFTKQNKIKVIKIIFGEESAKEIK